MSGIEFYKADDVDDLIKSLTDDGEKIKVSAEALSNIIAEEGIKKAKDLTKFRLPSSGGSYLDSIKAESSGNEPKFSVKIYSDHQWAQAVEYGTKKHDIVAKFGGIGSHAAAQIARENPKDFKIAKKHIKIGTPETIGWGLVHGNYSPVNESLSRRNGWRGETLNVAKKLRPIIGIMAHTPMYDPNYLKDASSLDYQLTLAHEFLHRYTAKKRGHVKMYDQYSDPVKRDMMEVLADKGFTRALEIAHKAKNKGKADFKENVVSIGNERIDTKTYDVAKAGGGRLIFEDTLPRGNKRMGVKYEKFKFVGEKVEHPGARAFNIFGDTQEWINKNLDIFISQAWKGIKQRKRR
jgi:hypothetical protein